jgi:beta-N-acetylhexosaminidase
MDPLQAFLPPLPSPRATAEKGRAAVQRLGELVGAALQLFGFNTNFAPPLDLGPSVANSTRTFSTDPQKVTECGGAFLTGLSRYRVRACGKHFPGSGSARTANANEVPIVSKPMAELWREDLVPYRALLPRLPLVLVSTAAYKAYDFDLLQSAGLSSKVVEGLLRVKLGYEGVAIASGLETEAVRGALSLEEAAVQAVSAGCDMLLVEDSQTAERARAAWSAAFQSGKLLGPRLEQALERVQLVKRGLRAPANKLPHGAFDKLTKEFRDFSTAFAGSDKV